MDNITLLPKDKVVILLSKEPEILDMREFSARRKPTSKRSSALKQNTRGLNTSNCGTTVCLAGAILRVANIELEFDKHGFAIGLAEGEIPPSAEWITYERQLSVNPIDPSKVAIPAKAREVYADAHGAAAAKLLPFYGPDWAPTPLGKVTATQVIDLLQIVNRVVV